MHMRDLGILLMAGVLIAVALAQLDLPLQTQARKCRLVSSGQLSQRMAKCRD